MSLYTEQAYVQGLTCIAKKTEFANAIATMVCSRFVCTKGGSIILSNVNPDAKIMYLTIVIKKFKNFQHLKVDPKHCLSRNNLLVILGTSN